uniref:BHLH domain-containing protein n=1 Tax=Ornithorhynchus anatinus TaxID=9258 RepID=A0A6I8NTW7_ORNAN
HSALPPRRGSAERIARTLSPGLGTGPGTAPAPAPGDMKGCYSRLKELVPTLPQDRRVSRVEILQHVIDYIWDLQLEPPPAPRDPPHPSPARPGAGGPRRSGGHKPRFRLD